MNKLTYISIAFVAMVIGLMMAFQFRTAGVSQGVPYSRVQELIVEKKQLEKDLEHLQEEAADLAAKLEEVGKGTSEAAAALEEELSNMRLYAGLVPVSGPGVEVVLENPPEHVGHGTSSGSYTIRDDVILKVINELRGAGAEALAINGQRIMATSEVRMAGNHINVNLTRLSFPYKITAIGDPIALKSCLEIKGGLVEYLNNLGVVVTVQKKERVVIPAYKGVLRFEYAKPCRKTAET